MIEIVKAFESGEMIENDDSHHFRLTHPTFWKSEFFYRVYVMGI
ncbi:MAG: hypothetical protein AAGC64_11210 [Bacteroidota bacterium]